MWILFFRLANSRTALKISHVAEFESSYLPSTQLAALINKSQNITQILWPKCTCPPGWQDIHVSMNESMIFWLANTFWGLNDVEASYFFVIAICQFTSTSSSHSVLTFPLTLHHNYWSGCNEGGKVVMTLSYCGVSILILKRIVLCACSRIYGHV